MKNGVGAGVVLAAGLCVGCATSYAPRPGPRVAMVIRGGNPAFVRDGKTYEGGVFGGGLVEAVHGNPEAEAHARAYRNLNIGGVCALLGGGVSAISGIVLTAGADHRDGTHDSTQRAAGEALLIGGLAAYITGFVLILNAPPHVFDAVNVFNDGLPSEAFQRPLVTPAYGPTRAAVRAAPAAPVSAAPPVAGAPVAPARASEAPLPPSEGLPTAPTAPTGPAPAPAVH